MADNDTIKLVTAKTLQRGWERYTELFGVWPHGTLKQLAAVLELIPEIDQGMANDSGTWDEYRKIKTQWANRPNKRVG